MFPKRKAGIDSPVMCIILKLSSEGALGLGKGCLDAGNRETGRAFLLKKDFQKTKVLWVAEGLHCSVCYTHWDVQPWHCKIS